MAIKKLDNHAQLSVKQLNSRTTGDRTPLLNDDYLANDESRSSALGMTPTPKHQSSSSQSHLNLSQIIREMSMLNGRVNPSLANRNMRHINKSTDFSSKIKTKAYTDGLSTPYQAPPQSTKELLRGFKHPSRSKQAKYSSLQKIRQEQHKMQLSKQTKNLSIESDELDLGLIEVLSPVRVEEPESFKFNL